MFAVTMFVISSDYYCILVGQSNSFPLVFAFVYSWFSFLMLALISVSF